MDRFIRTFDAVEDRDLMLCHQHGVAYQREMSSPVPYDAAYFDKYVGYEGTDIAQRINSARLQLVDRFLLSSVEPVLDVGIGSGEFLKNRPNARGHDINPKAVEWLKAEGRWAPDLRGFNVFTFWDVLEHVPEPDCYFKQMRTGSLLFTCIPIFVDLNHIRESKHYRPNEHFYYWTEHGFVEWMRLHGFWLLGSSDDETNAGRDSILSFAFRREG